MRKIDYSILADTIKSAKNTSAREGNPPEWQAGYNTACEIIARNFANRASVKKEEFIAACGYKIASH